LPLLHALAERPPLARTVPAVDLRAGERPPEALPLPSVHEATTVPLPQSQPVPKVQSTAPLSTEGEGLRRIVLVSKVRQLLQALKKAASLQRSAVFRIGALGLVVGLVVGLVLRSVNQPQRETRPNTDNELVFGLGDFGFKIKPPDYWSMQGDNWAEQQNNALRLGLGWGLGAGVVVIGLQIALRRLRLYSIRQAAAGLRKDLMAEFPGAVQSWGGEVVLHDPASVKEILHTLETERS
jgi:hypothetical protein